MKVKRKRKTGSFPHQNLIKIFNIPLHFIIFITGKFTEQQSAN